MKAITITTENKKRNPKYIKGVIGGIQQFSLSRFPRSWNNGDKLQGANYETESDQTHEADGFYHIVKPVITEYQRLINLHFDIDVFTYEKEEFSQEEKDTHDQNKLDSDPSAQKNQKYKSDGEIKHRRFWDFVMRNYDEEKIDDAELEEISVTLYAPTAPLTLGFWKIAQSLVNDIQPSSNNKVNAAISKVKNGIDNYIIENGI